MNFDKDYSWSTHLPMIRLMMRLVKPKMVVELGVGIHSTREFMKYENCTYFPLEQDKEWADTVSAFYELGVNYHDCGDLKVGTFLHELTEKQKTDFVNTYTILGNQVEATEETPKLLFVDNFASSRTLAINTLASLFDVVIYHDCEPAGIPYYHYNLLGDFLKKDFVKYVLQTPSSWTGCFIKKDFLTEALEEEISNESGYEIEKYVKSYNGLYSQINQFKLVKDE